MLNRQALELPRLADPACAIGRLTKAQLLQQVGHGLASAEVPVGRIVEWLEWRASPAAVLRDCLAVVAGGAAAVRSSSSQEDRAGRSQAGRFLTLLDVHRDRLATAIAEVFASYGAPTAEDQVLVQRSLGVVDAALVAASRCAPDGADCVSVSIAQQGSTRSVTDGSSAAETWFVALAASRERLPAPIAAARDVVEEIAGRLPPGIDFELELAWRAGRMWLLQVRPIHLPPRCAEGIEAATRARIGRRLQALAGDGVRVLGLMPDWNPAELLGEQPRPLALSLFEALIGDQVWWQARCALGYARPPRSRLLQPLAGRPYVDVATSLASFVPVGLGQDCAERLVGAWLERLQACPQLHDRVEFDLALTCLEFDARQRLAASGIAAADAKRLIAALCAPTLACLEPRALHWMLARFRAEAAAGASTAERLAGICGSLALPFAMAARCDFAAHAMLRSAVRCGALSGERLEALARSVGSMAGALGDELRADAMQGAARAGTFDILSPRHAELLPPGRPRIAAGEPFVLAAHERNALQRLLSGAGLALAPDRLVAAAMLAVRARELGKFVLAGRLSGCLEAIARRAEERGLTREQASWLPWRRWDEPDPARLAAEAEAARETHAAEARIRMPALLFAGDDLAAVRFEAQRPSYLGGGRICAPLRQVGRYERPEVVPRGAVIAIESADPGFDWIFARQPAALLTAWGGPHSHMALRCRELACPVVLGLGPERFRRLCRAERVSIDFSSQVIHVA